MPIPIPNQYDYIASSTSQKRTLDQDIDDADMLTDSDEQPLSKHRRIEYGSRSSSRPISDECLAEYTAATMRATLANLPNDILLLIFANVNVNDILALRMVGQHIPPHSFFVAHSCYFPRLTIVSLLVSCFALALVAVNGTAARVVFVL